MRIYLSYSHQDKAVVDQIVARLKSEGHDIWIELTKNPGW